MKKVISSILSPNFEKDDVALSLKLVFSPWHWKKGEKIRELERTFKEKFGLGDCFSFNSGRSCLLAVLRAMDIKEGDEVIVQGFTCNAVVNPIIKTGARAVFVDLKKDLNIDEKRIEEKISSRTRAVIVQHTFGWPAEIEPIKEICQRNNLYLIEDCAHALGAKYDNKYCGSFGDASFFSFGKDKIVSSVFGGMLTINNQKLVNKVREIYEKSPFPSSLWIFQQLFYPFLMEYFFLPLFRFRLGRIFWSLMFELNVFSLRSVTKKENRGVLPSSFGKKLPNALACLALNQLNKLDRFNGHRREIARIYFKELRDISVFSEDFNEREPVFMRFPLLTDKSSLIISELRKSNVFLNDGWRGTIVVPPKTFQEKMGYEKGECRLAEKVSKNIVSLPTHIKVSLEEAEEIASIIRSLVNKG
ncbi:MAG: aminotransferase class V-fold PLP-dependent enzyme [Candidatus Pacebacteria bacterium]|nr:aminotransferase class V-fold PLP-dependent enzyme [Candidatus Paceibacterota bacterium]